LLDSLQKEIIKRHDMSVKWARDNSTNLHDMVMSVQMKKRSGTEPAIKVDAPPPVPGWRPLSELISSSSSSSYRNSSSNSCISSNNPHSLLSSIPVSWPGSISSFDSCASYSNPFYDDFSCFFHSTPYGSISTISHTSCSSDSYSSLPSSTNPSSASSPYNSIEDSLSKEGDSLSASDCVASDENDDLPGMVSTQVGGLRPFSEIVGKVDGRPCMLRPFSDILNGQG